MEPFVLESALGAVTMGMVGLVSGLAQWLVLRGWIRRAVLWVPLTMLGWAASGVARFWMVYVLEEMSLVPFDLLEWMGLAMLIPIAMGAVHEGLTGFLVGILQWPVLVGQVRRARRWIRIHTLSWALGGAAMGTLGWLVGESFEELGALVPMGSGVIPAFFAAAGITWLLARRRGE
jgi:hypothetical protein